MEYRIPSDRLGKQNETSLIKSLFATVAHRTWGLPAILDNPRPAAWLVDHSTGDKRAALKRCYSDSPKAQDNKHLKHKRLIDTSGRLTLHREDNTTYLPWLCEEAG